MSRTQSFRLEHRRQTPLPPFVTEKRIPKEKPRSIEATGQGGESFYHTRRTERPNVRPGNAGIGG